jgi:hypothetical protein
MVPFTQKEGYAPKQPEVLRVNPKRQVPVLIDGALEIFRFHPDLRISRRHQAASCAVACGSLPREPGLAGWSMNRTRSISRISSN